MKDMNQILFGAILSAVAFSLSYGGHHEASSNRNSNRPSPHSKEGVMMTYDTNFDGKVSEAEFLAARVISFKEKDFNGDGVVTEAEYVAEWEIRLDQQLEEQRAASVKQAQSRYGVLDKDKNENMTLDEFHASGERIFSRYDTNRDRIISEGDEEPLPYGQSSDMITKGKEGKNPIKRIFNFLGGMPKT